LDADIRVVAAVFDRCTDAPANPEPTAKEQDRCMDQDQGSPLSSMRKLLVVVA